MSRLVQVRNRNNIFQHLEVLKRNREKRTKAGEFLVEGVTAINLALKHGWEFRSFVYSRGANLSRWAMEILPSAEEQIELPPELMSELSDKDETSELLAVLRMRRQTLGELPGKHNGLLLVFDRPGNPGNLGSSIRSADAFGVDGVVITGHAVDTYDPEVVRASVGTVFSTPIIREESPKQLVDWVAGQRAAGFGYQIIGTSGKADSVIGDADFSKPTVLVMGNETAGISRGYSEICDAVVRIPIGGALSSLNVSCAATVMLYEVCRQRAAAAIN